MMRRTFLILAIVILAGSTVFAQTGDQINLPIVKTKDGKLQGIVSSGIEIFKGIPFAQPPVGDLRWKEPQPVRNWKGVRNADQFGAYCTQRAGGDYWHRGNGMSEDCLFLNVWPPAKAASERLPVLVYIFGVGFTNVEGSEPR